MEKKVQGEKQEELGAGGREEGKEAEGTTALTLIPEKEVSINRTGGNRGRTRNQELWAPSRGQGKALNVWVSGILPHPCLYTVSHASCGKKYTVVCSVLCFFNRDGLLKSIYHFLGTIYLKKQHSVKKRKEAQPGA